MHLRDIAMLVYVFVVQQLSDSSKSGRHHFIFHHFKLFFETMKVRGIFLIEAQILKLDAVS